MVKDNQVFTPPISDGALPSVIRSILLEEFNQEFLITEQSISPAELMLADEVFLTNALMGIKPLGKLNTKKFDSFAVAHSISRALCEQKNYI